MTTWSLLHTDNFNRANGSILGGAMSDGIGTWANPTGSAWDIDTNTCVNSTWHLDDGIWDSAMADSGDQRAEAIILTGDSGVIVRHNAVDNGDAAFYMVYFASGTVYVYRRDAGAWTGLGAVGSASGGEVFRIDAEGSDLSAYLDDVLQGSPVTDATYSSGRAGLYGGGGGTSQWEDFKVYLPDAGGGTAADVDSEATAMGAAAATSALSATAASPSSARDAAVATGAIAATASSQSTARDAAVAAGAIAATSTSESSARDAAVAMGAIAATAASESSARDASAAVSASAATGQHAAESKSSAAATSELSAAAASESSASSASTSVAGATGTATVDSPATAGSESAATSAQAAAGSSEASARSSAASLSALSASVASESSASSSSTSVLGSFLLATAASLATTVSLLSASVATSAGSSGTATAQSISYAVTAPPQGEPKAPPEKVFMKQRIHNALYALVRSGPFYPCTVNPKTGAMKVDTTKTVTPDVVVKETETSWRNAADYRRSFGPGELESWSWFVVADFPSQEVACEVFEENANAGGIKIPEIEGLPNQRTLLVRLAKSGYLHPPEQSPNRGTRVTFEFEVVAQTLRK